MADPQDDDMLTYFAAIEDARSLTNRERSSSAHGTVSAARIALYARRDGAIADLSLEKLIRGNGAVRLIYRQALALSSDAISERAIAASGEKVLIRTIGGHKLECIEDETGACLVIYLTNSEPVPKIIEIRAADGTGTRLVLPKPIRKVIQLAFNDRDANLVEAYELITRPDSSIYFLC